MTKAPPFSPQATAELEKLIKLDRGRFRKIATRAHALTYRISRGRLGSKLDSEVGQRPVLLLTTIGRHSGKPRTVPVVYLKADDSYLVVGANAGRDSDPAWALNLRTQPTAEIRVNSEQLTVRASELTAEQAADYWPPLDAMNTSYAYFRTLTDRTLPVFKLAKNHITI